jgi:hypothetical protein
LVDKHYLIKHDTVRLHVPVRYWDKGQMRLNVNVMGTTSSMWWKKLGKKGEKPQRVL